MNDRYELKTGQINFENTNNPGAYACVVIKNGEFVNLTDDLHRMLITKLQQPVRAVPTPDIEDMF